MSIGPFCGLCGSPFERDLEPSHDASYPVPWSRKGRAVRADESRRHITLTEVGYVQGFRLIIHKDGEIGPDPTFLLLDDQDVDDEDEDDEDADDQDVYDEDLNDQDVYDQDVNDQNVNDQDVDDQFEEVSLLRVAFTRRPQAYAVHDFCWDLFKIRVRCNLPDESKEAKLAETLFWQLDSLPMAGFNYLVPENQYDGTINLRKQNPGLSFLFSDPNQMLSLTNNLVGNGDASCSNSDSIKREPPTDVFARLPREITWKVLEELPSQDVSNLRLASSSVALASTSEFLPQAFWATRFAPNRELGFVFAHKTPQKSGAKKPWRLLYHEYTKALKNGEENQGIRNRWRMHRCVAGFALTAEQLLHQDTHCITDNDELQSYNANRNPCAPSRVSLSCPLLADTDHREPQLRRAVQPIARMQINLVAPAPAVSLHISVSFLHYNCKVYISGFRSYCLDRSGQSFGPRSIGTIIPSTEEHIEIPSTAEILAVEVIASDMGLHGLVFHLDHCGEADSVAVGTTTCLDGSFGKAVLQGTRNLAGMVIHFDVLKAVAIKVVEDRYGSMVPFTNDNGPHRLWNPAPLEEQAELKPPLPRISQAMGEFPLHLNMGFGGSNGQKLSSLNRITACVLYETGFHGLRFGYDNNEEIIFGRDSISEEDNGSYWPCIEPTFAIDGQGGERITFFVVRRVESWEYRGKIILSIEVSTNRGRSMNFRIQSTHPRHPRAVSSFKIGASDGELPIAIVATCKPPHAPWESLHVLNGTETHHRTSAFENQRALGTGNSLEVTKDWINESAGWMLRSGGSCSGAASLQGIKRVRVSSGLRGRSRSPGHISGLWIEYYQGDDVVLGQWIHEVGSFDLTQTEYLTHVSVWSTLESGTNCIMEFGTEEDRFGKVTGIKFITSAGQRYEFVNDSNHPCIYMHWRSTPYEELRNMTWAFGQFIDEVQIIHQSVPSSARSCLILYDLPRLRRPPDLSSKTSRRERSPDGQWARLLEAHIFFDKQALVGVEFVYELGIVTRLGSNLGESYDLSLDEGENIDILAVEEKGKKISSVELHTDRGKSLRAPGNDQSDDSLCQAVFKLDKRPDSANKFEGDRKFVFSFQDAEDIGPCVGLWFLAMQDEGELRFESAGPIFLAKGYADRV
ncbi:unnamed protein product [Clonostachys rosea]|uniref:F-box domain-containing protein n=1 Tax=Bionectria ochroleuca TaxID=29856 RepID=A0ABY6V089_BIOOC|nr:unnamed protein product [Clonostachys rosea]